MCNEMRNLACTPWNEFQGSWSPKVFACDRKLHSAIHHEFYPLPPPLVGRGKLESCPTWFEPPIRLVSLIEIMSTLF